MGTFTNNYKKLVEYMKDWGGLGSTFPSSEVQGHITLTNQNGDSRNITGTSTTTLPAFGFIYSTSTFPLAASTKMGAGISNATLGTSTSTTNTTTIKPRTAYGSALVIGVGSGTAAESVTTTEMTLIPSYYTNSIISNQLALYQSFDNETGMNYLIITNNTENTYTIGEIGIYIDCSGFTSTTGYSEAGSGLFLLWRQKVTAKTLGPGERVIYRVRNTGDV